MSTTLLIVAFVVALLSVPTIAGITAWGLAGGDGSPKNPAMGLLGALVGGGAVYNVVICLRTFFLAMPTWAWWLMWAPCVAGLLGILLAGEELRNVSWRDWAVGIGMQLGLAAPAVLVWLGGMPA